MRKLFVLFLAAVVLLTAGCSAQSNTEDITVKYTFPGEWEEHEGTWLIWPHNFGVIEPEYVDMIDDIWDRAYIMHQGEILRVVERTDVSEGQSLKQIFFEVTENAQ